MNVKSGLPVNFGFLSRSHIEQLFPGTVLSSDNKGDILLLSTPELKGGSRQPKTYTANVMHRDAHIALKTFPIDPSIDADPAHTLKREPLARDYPHFQAALADFIGPTLWQQNGNNGIGTLH